MDSLCSKNVKLRYVEKGDAAFILSLLNDKKLNKYLPKIETNLQKQEAIIEKYKVKERTSEHYFIIEDKVDNSPIGTAHIFEVRGNTFSWGDFLVKAEAVKSAALEAAMLIYNLAFLKLGFQKTNFNIHKEDKQRVSFHTKLGAQIIKEDSEYYYFCFDKDNYKKLKEKYGEYLKNDTIPVKKADLTPVAKKNPSSVAAPIVEVPANIADDKLQGIKDALEYDNLKECATKGLSKAKEWLQNIKNANKS